MYQQQYGNYEKCITLYKTINKSKVHGRPYSNGFSGMRVISWQCRHRRNQRSIPFGIRTRKSQGVVILRRKQRVSFRDRLIFQRRVYRAIVNCKIYQDQRGRHNSGGCYPGGMKHGGQTRHKYPVAEQSRSREQAQTRCGVATSSISNNLLSRDCRILEIRTRTQL